MSAPQSTGKEGRAGMAWAVHILARLQSDRVGAFVPNPAGKVQMPCRYAVRCALDALALESLDEALQRPALAAQITAMVRLFGVPRHHQNPCKKCMAPIPPPPSKVLPGAPRPRAHSAAKKR